MSDRCELSLNVNGRQHQLVVEPRRLLCDVLREDLGLIGTHVSCELGVCGVCTVLIGGKSARSCLTLAVQAQGHEIETVEALNQEQGLNVLQQAFQDHHALQCGFCTPGFLVVLSALLRDKPDASDTDIDDVLDEVVCRCTGYQNIVKAARAARDTLRAASSRTAK